MLSLELCKCSSDIYLSTRPRTTGLATTYITGYGWGTIGKCEEHNNTTTAIWDAWQKPQPSRIFIIPINTVVLSGTIIIALCSPCCLVYLGAFSIISDDQWTATAQGEGGWHKTAEQGVGRFMVKCIAADNFRTGLRPAVVCPNVKGRAKKRITQSKRVRAGLLA